MTKSILIAVAVLVLGGAAWLFLSTPTADAPSTDAVSGGAATDTLTTTDNMDEINEAFSGTASFADLLGRGESFICAFQSDVDGVVSTGDFYTDGERFRVSATYEVDGISSHSDIINNGATTYVWSDSPEGTVGFMMANDLAATEAGDGGPYTEQTNSFDVDQSVTYECERWLVNESFFTPPSDVEFVDIQMMMQGMQEAFGLPAQ